MLRDTASLIERLNYDREASQMRAATAAGFYALETPRVDCDRKFFANPRLRGKVGVSLKEQMGRTDVESDLQGQTRATSRDCTAGRVQNPATNVVNSAVARHQPEADIHIDETQFTNPACTLRGTGVNRWEWLPHDPQAAAINEMDVGVSTRRVAADNHRPQLPTPVPETAGQPVMQATTENSQGARIHAGPGAGFLLDSSLRAKNPLQNAQMQKADMLRFQPNYVSRPASWTRQMTRPGVSQMRRQKERFESLAEMGPTNIERLPFPPKLVEGARP